MLRMLICFMTLSLHQVAPVLAQDQTSEGLFERISKRAQTLADSPYEPSKASIPESLQALDYQSYRDIRFDKSEALWRSDALFNIELFHLGFLYTQPVILNEVVDGDIRPIPYDPSLFDYGRNSGLEDNLSPRLGFAGFRVHYPLNKPDYKDEVAVFLGASYFRMVGRGQRYGLSARGLAVDTALPEGEEFPRFEEFWLVKPEPEATSLTVYALLNSESLTGAYRFDLYPGASLNMDIKARLFARRDVQKLGVAPLTSMFMWGENRVRLWDDHRPEVHDSDALVLHSGSGEWIRRPLVNPVDLRVTSLTAKNPEGFGLVQSDRNFNHYLDMSAHYEKRPSLWVKPLDSGWDKGVVQLVEIPSDDESNDNIVAFWVPDKPLKAGDSREFRYRLEAFVGDKTPDTLAAVKRTRIGWGATPGARDKPPRSLRQFIVDFEGGPLHGLAAQQPVEVSLTASNGEARDITVERMPSDTGWRVAFKLSPDKADEAADLRLHLTLRNKRISETWNYVWNPGAVE